MTPAALSGGFGEGDPLGAQQGGAFWGWMRKFHNLKAALTWWAGL